jgi:ADP-ribosylglycohydrolase
MTVDPDDGVLTNPSSSAPCPSLARFTGALLGGAIGDALGYPLEGAGGNGRRARLGWITDYVPVSHKGPRGLISDDTQLTIHVAASLVARGWLDPADLAPRFIDWLAEMRGAGKATVEAVRRLAAGVPWPQAGAESAGNGAAMRVAPIGLLRWNDPVLLRAEAILSALPTHRHPMGVAGAVAMAAAVAWLVRQEPGAWTVAAFIHTVQQAIAGLESDPVVERQHPGVQTTLYERLGELPALLALEPGAYFTRYSGAFVLESLPAAFYCFLRTPDDVETMLLTAVNHARDADTVAALAGTLGGALGGVDTLPIQLRAPLERREELLTLAEQLYLRAGGTLPDFPEPPSDDPAAAGRMLLLMVAELHRRGYEQVRILPGMAPSGMFWRCAISPATHREDPPKDPLVLHYTSGQERAYFGWTDAAADGAAALAAKFLARFPALCAAAHGRDPAYVTWYREMLHRTAPAGLPIAYADWALESSGWPVVNDPAGRWVPAPPPAPGRPDAASGAET